MRRCLSLVEDMICCEEIDRPIQRLRYIRSAVCSVDDVLFNA